MSVIFDTHREYLSDEPRVAAFRQAIEVVVRPGDVVLDLGCGTGIMGLLACRAGAARVYAMDEGGIIGLARDAARSNGYGDRISFLRGNSTQLDLPEKVDIIVGDQIGRFGYEAGLFQCFADARNRFLKPRGKLIPESVDLWVAPVTFPEKWAHADFWGTSPAGFDFSAARRMAMNSDYAVTLEPSHLLAPPQRGLRVDLYAVDPSGLRVEASFAAQAEGLLHGIGGWFEAGLTAGVRLTNSPLSPARIDRRNVLLPINEPVRIQHGDTVRTQIQIIPAESIINWKVQVERKPVDAGQPATRRFAHSKLLGLFLSEEDIRRTRPDYVPRLSNGGEARRAVLEMVDGKRNRAEIEQAILRRFPALFPSPRQAAAFVSRALGHGTI